MGLLRPVSLFPEAPISASTPTPISASTSTPISASTPTPISASTPTPISASTPAPPLTAPLAPSVTVPTAVGDQPSQPEFLFPHPPVKSWPSPELDRACAAKYHERHHWAAPCRTSPRPSPDLYCCLLGVECHLPPPSAPVASLPAPAPHPQMPSPSVPSRPTPRPWPIIRPITPQPGSSASRAVNQPRTPFRSLRDFIRAMAASGPVRPSGQPPVSGGVRRGPVRRAHR
ncbi:hypothetical protein M8J76_017280 [Diaphorina citri]|nr:hypothetical protein M8J76_017280 [Diaphorina citri]